MNLTKLTLLSSAFIGLVHGAESKLDKDREAILSLAGEYEVDFLFLETMSLSKGYKKKAKIYNEDAYEKVVLVKNDPNEIELQHILVADGTIVKHWAQIWTFEDQEIVRFQKDNTWKIDRLSEEKVKGTWSQLVTQTTDSPRYESFGTWIHHGDSSVWEGDVTRRPLPRREYKKRSDYDYLVAVNRHTVTPEGWYHEQDNIKQVDRDGKKISLSREVGFNQYMKVEGVDFDDVDEYWAQTKGFWLDMKTYWRGVESNAGLAIQPKVGDASMRTVFGNWIDKVEAGGKIDIADIEKQMSTFVTVEKQK